MDINYCPNCQKQFDQDKRVSKQLPCGCVTCLKCLKNVYQFQQEIKCRNHQKVYKIGPEELQDYICHKQVRYQVLQPQEKFIDQEKITEQLRWLQDQSVSKQNHYREIMKVIQNDSQFFQHIQSLSSQAILKSLIDQCSISNDKINKLFQRLSELQVANEVQQQKVLILGQQDPQLRQNVQGQLQQYFQQILREIEELKKDQWMDVQSLRTNVQRYMFGMFIYLSESSSDQLLADREAELLIQKYFKQFKVLSGLSQVSSSVVQQKSQLQSQITEQQISQEIQNEFSVINQINQINLPTQEQAMSIESMSLVSITFDKLVQFLSQIKEENVSLQTLYLSPLNKSGLIEYPQILLQLSTVTNQQVCLKLIEIIYLSKKQPKIQQAAANALTMLNYMNFAFNNIDFSNLDLSNSDISDTSFTNCNFANSNLTQANLRNSKFINCDLSNSNLTSIITEHPHIFIGHTDRVTSISISSDSEFIVSGSRDYTVRLWDVKTDTCKTMSGHTKYVNAVAISNDSEFIVSGSDDKTVRLWDVKTGNSQTMSGHTSSVYAVAISNDSEFIVSGSGDNTVRLWNIKTDTCKTMSGHTRYVIAVAISNDSEFIVSGSSDKTVRLWDVKTGNSQTMSGHTGLVFSVSISSDSQYIVSGSGDNTIKL